MPCTAGPASAAAAGEGRVRAPQRLCTTSRRILLATHRPTPAMQKRRVCPTRPPALKTSLPYRDNAASPTARTCDPSPKTSAPSPTTSTLPPTPACARQESGESYSDPSHCAGVRPTKHPWPAASLARGGKNMTTFAKRRSAR